MYLIIKMIKKTISENYFYSMKNRVNLGMLNKLTPASVPSTEQ